jgi:hypothetical protein
MPLPRRDRRERSGLGRVLKRTQEKFAEDVNWITVFEQ